MAVKSVKYPKKGTGYLYNKLERPVKPDIYTRGRYKKSEFKHCMGYCWTTSIGLFQTIQELFRAISYNPFV